MCSPLSRGIYHCSSSEVEREFSSTPTASSYRMKPGTVSSGTTAVTVQSMHDTDHGIKIETYDNYVPGRFAVHPERNGLLSFVGFFSGVFHKTNNSRVRYNAIHQKRLLLLLYVN